MNTHGFIRWLRLALVRWLLHGMEHQLELRPVIRDQRGRFTSTKTPPSALPPPLEGIGITERMLTQATPLELPPEALDDLGVLQRTLRHWVLRNMDHWVNGKGRSVAPVMHTLMQTWALDRLQRVQAKVRENNNRTITVRYEHPPVGYNLDTRVGAGPAPARGDQGAAAPHHGNDCSLPNSPMQVTAWQAADPSELCTPEGSAQSRTNASQGAERPCHSPIPKTGEALRASSYAGAAAPATLLIRDRSGLSDTADTRTIAGGRKALPYATDESAIELEKRAKCPRSEALGAATTPDRTEVTIPVYDPSYDVVGKLPKYILDEPCEAGLLRGFGNRHNEAAKNYYDRNIANYRNTGRDWQEFGFGCRVFECQDANGRTYFMALAAAAARWTERVLSYQDWLRANDLDFEDEDEYTVGAERSLGPLSSENEDVARLPQRRQPALPPYEPVGAASARDPWPAYRDPLPRPPPYFSPCDKVPHQLDDIRYV